tara:strand:- start:337 stop:1335 length:999 start_codon:yes stop_codon:yes gene_type:complete
MKIELDNWYKCKIDKKILKELSKKSDLQGLKHVVIYFTSLFLTGYMAYYTWGTWWSVFWFWMYGSMYASADSLWHETGHRTAFKSRILNEIFYQIGSFMNWKESTRWRWSHFHHHSYTLSTADPYDFEIQVTKPTDLINLFLQVFPFGGLLTVFSKYGLQFGPLETVKHALGFVTPVIKDCIPEKERSKCRWISRIYVTIWLSIIILTVYLNTWMLLLYLLLPYWYGNTIYTIIGMMQHAGLLNNSKDHRLSTRTVILNPVFSFFYWHMEYHTEHHMFPTIPSYNLKKLHAIVRDQMPPARKGMWGAYKEILPALLKQAKDPNYKINVAVPN